MWVIDGVNSAGAPVLEMLRRWGWWSGSSVWVIYWISSAVFPRLVKHRSVSRARESQCGL